MSSFRTTSRSTSSSFGRSGPSFISPYVAATVSAMVTRRSFIGNLRGKLGGICLETRADSTGPSRDRHPAPGSPRPPSITPLPSPPPPGQPTIALSAIGSPYHPPVDHDFLSGDERILFLGQV